MYIWSKWQASMTPKRHMRTHLHHTGQWASSSPHCHSTFRRDKGSSRRCPDPWSGCGNFPWGRGTGCWSGFRWDSSGPRGTGTARSWWCWTGRNSWWDRWSTLSARSHCCRCPKDTPVGRRCLLGSSGRWGTALLWLRPTLEQQRHFRVSWTVSKQCCRRIPGLYS